jgi:hypothetical protein
LKKRQIILGKKLMKIKLLFCILLSLGVVSMAWAVESASSLVPVQVAVDGKDAHDEAPSCIEQFDIQEEWPAADCSEITTECPLNEEGVTLKTASKLSCTEALTACHQNCEAE